MMPIENMHQDFRMKMNAVDEEKYYDFTIPEVDWLLNEAYENLIRRALFPLHRQQLEGIGQRTIDDFSEALKEVQVGPVDIATGIDLPDDYMYFVRGRCKNMKDNCILNAVLIPRIHQRMGDVSVLDDTDPMWEEVNVWFRDGRMMFDDYPLDWKLQSVKYVYVKRIPYMHYASSIGGYDLPDGTVLSGKQGCPFKNEVCRDIVDIAVLIGTQGLRSLPDLNIKLQKLKSKNL